MQIDYSGEHLLPGILGHSFVAIAFASALIALLAYVISEKEDESLIKRKWRRIGNVSFLVHTLAVIGIMASLYYLIFNHAFEYDYVRRHSSFGMPLKYMISCFWAGQQGSFLLWLFWHSILGAVIIWWVKPKWSVPVLAVFSFIQLILLSMILGVELNRGIAVLMVWGLMTMPLVILLKNMGVAWGKGFVPFYNILAVYNGSKGSRHTNLAYTLAILFSAFLGFWLFNHMADIGKMFTSTVAIGVSPFELARTKFGASPIFLYEDYITRLQGTGLNPLLQNYWMVIHPPTLFLGFASTLVPFGFAVAGLWKREYANWTKPALPWTIFSAMILGTGIMMGGVWAYESLSFGGFWAWDPVENASFVPWLTLVAALHTLLIFKHTRHALKATYILMAITFFLVLYSTFLTRSGILSSSVHSFTDLGMMGQLLLLMGVMVIPTIVWLTVRWSDIPSPEKEEKADSREFWMFIGSLLLLISAAMITFFTSLDVLNSIATWINNVFGLSIKDNFAISDPEHFYNTTQVWVGILIVGLTGMVQFLRYKRTNKAAKLLNHLLISLVISFALSLLLMLNSGVREIPYFLLLFTGLFGVVANLEYFITVFRGKIRIAGSSIAHVGFGLVLVGVVIALSDSSVISKNTSGVAFNEEFGADFNTNNVKLNKYVPVQMGDYMVTYTGRRQDSIDFYYRVDYERFDPNSGELVEQFYLEPHLMDHPTMDIVTNPATKHYPHKDIFTHITSIPKNSQDRDVSRPVPMEIQVRVGDTFAVSNGLMIFKNFRPVMQDSMTIITAELLFDDLHHIQRLEPKYIIDGHQVRVEEAVLGDKGLSISLESINPTTGKFTFKILEPVDWIVMKAIVFPFINILWMGIIVTIIGLLISLLRRIREYRKIRHRSYA